MLKFNVRSDTERNMQMKQLIEELVVENIRLREMLVAPCNDNSVNFYRAAIRTLQAEVSRLYEERDKKNV